MLSESLETQRYKAVEDCWSPPTSHSAMFSDQEGNEGKINKLDRHHALLEIYKKFLPPGAHTTVDHDITTVAIMTHRQVWFYLLAWAVPPNHI